MRRFLIAAAVLVILFATTSLVGVAQAHPPGGYGYGHGGYRYGYRGPAIGFTLPRYGRAIQYGPTYGYYPSYGASGYYGPAYRAPAYYGPGGFYIRGRSSTFYYRY